MALVFFTLLPAGIQMQKVPNVMNKDGQTVESTSKIRQLLTQALPNKPMSHGLSHDDISIDDDPIARLAKNRGISGKVLATFEIFFISQTLKFPKDFLKEHHS